MSFKDDDDQESHKRYYRPNMEIKGNVMINGRNFFDQPVKKDLKTYDNIRKFQQVKEMTIQLVVF